MKTKSKQYQELVVDFMRRLQDVRFAGQVLFVVIVLLISWSGVKAIQTNYGLQKQISQLKQENAVAQLQNDNQRLQNQYYQSDQYLELSARQNLGLAAPGEKELIVPKSVALSYTVKIPDDTPEAATQSHQPAWQRNFQDWVNFFLHRQATD